MNYCNQYFVKLFFDNLLEIETLFVHENEENYFVEFTIKKDIIRLLFINEILLYDFLYKYLTSNFNKLVKLKKFIYFIDDIYTQNYLLNLIYNVPPNLTEIIIPSDYNIEYDIPLFTYVKNLSINSYIGNLTSFPKLQNLHFNNIIVSKDCKNVYTNLINYLKKNPKLNFTYDKIDIFGPINDSYITEIKL